MENHFSVCNFQIPIELKPLYQEVSNNFEATLRDAVREKTQNKKENSNEQTKKVS